MNEKETGVIGGVEQRRIEIIDHQEIWPRKFEEHLRLIAAALDVRAIRIEHIGSTSVPGLAAKPIIDILLVVEDSADEESYLPQLESVGYQLRVREPDFYEHRMLRTPAKDVHVHIFSPDSPEIERCLIFRDRLRQNVHDRQVYEETKRRLALRTWVSMDAYAQAKSEVVENIIAAARSSAP